MEAAVQAGDWQGADRYARQVLIARPDDPTLVTKVAAVAARCDRKREAATLLVDAASLANFQPSSRVRFAMQALIDVGEIYSAIELLEKSLQAHPEEDDQRRILVGFLSEVQRVDLIPQHMKKLIQKRKFDLHLLLVTTETSSRRLSEHTMARMLERNPDDRRVRLAEAFLLFYYRDAKGAAEVLEDILARHPTFAPAHAMYGQALAESARWDEIPKWLAVAPAESSDFADYWLTLGDVATENGAPAEAVRAYWEATNRDPNRHKAWDRLQHAMHQLRASNSNYHDRIPDAQLQGVTDRVNELFLLRQRFNDFTGAGSKSQAMAADIANILLNLGRVWEAEAWSAVATTLSEQPSGELAGLREKIIEQLRHDNSWHAKDTPALAIDLSFLPPPQLDSDWQGPKRTTLIPSVATSDHLRMSEQSDRWGLRSIGEGNNPNDARLAALIRSTGVGGGAIDYDLDGLPDLLLMNAGGTMLKADSMPNELMRNVGNTFVRVSQIAGVDDKGFGQGVAVGDFNEDGLADLFFANLGTNRLLRNNGDGTFTDCTDRIQGDADSAWSTCGAFVDVNEDGIADLVVTNYCETVPNMDKACPNDEGILGPCHPLKFTADHDRFFLGTDDGRFVNVTADWVGPSAPGRALGIVAGAIDGRNLGIFIANDMSRNLFYAPQENHEKRLIDSAATRGLAVDGASRDQASMGVASSDFDLDGDLDFYVTGFAREYNVYYEQISPGLWKDETSKLGLVDPTLMMTGFGTQPIDMDSDGIDEIIVTNGHIGDFADPDKPPYEMPLQIFRRDASGSFALLDDDHWGDYFRKPHVGRALWTTDVNRDGRNDVMITHMAEQVCLLINESEGQNNRVAFKLVATDCSRDAVGAVIRFQVDGQRRTLWMLSGDGYMCSNEKTLIAGLGQAEKVTDVTVTWQDGSIDEIGTLDANAEYLIVQGQGEAFALHQYER